MAKRVRRDAKAKHSTDGVLPWQHAVAAVGLILVSLAIYAQTASFEFTNWDDPMLIVENRAVRSLSPAAVADMFTPKPGQTFQPLRVLSYAVDYQLWGGYSARGIHLVNVLLHTLASLLLYGAIWSFLEADPGRRQAGGWLCAGLFLAHPVNVESVAWCASRKYGLLAVFCFASLWLFICGVRKSSNLPLLISSFVCFVLALLSSPFAIVLPPILMLILYTREPGLSPLPILTKYRAAWIPYVVAFLLAVPALAFLLVRSSDGGISTDYHTGSPMHTFLSMMRVFTDYLRNLAAPFWLNNRYPNRGEYQLHQLEDILLDAGDCWCLRGFRLVYPARVTSTSCSASAGSQSALVLCLQPHRHFHAHGRSLSVHRLRRHLPGHHTALCTVFAHTATMGCRRHFGLRLCLWRSSAHQSLAHQ